MSKALDVQALQTASSLEILLVALYRKLLSASFVQNGLPLFGTFATQTLTQHDAHRQAVQGLSSRLGGRVQVTGDSKYLAVVNQADVSNSNAIIGVLSMFEAIVASTYQSNVAVVSDPRTKALLASIMGVEAQHLAVLGVVRELVAEGAGHLFESPLDGDLANFPPQAVGIPLSQVFPAPTNPSPPAEGATQ